ncbi:MAG: prepilin-type N-terminal cleavage/methylation domain-containing protein [Bacilli bacterium]|nr:prepilin-type N-terminal cleavage/methylation domain-containing protein [Bacilli bacterium]
MNKKGFTLIEVLATIAILAMLFAIGIPTFFAVSNHVKQKNYEDKKSYVLRKAEQWAMDTGRTVTNISHLIEEGYLDSDNERGDFLNPVNNESMLCDTIRIETINNQVIANFTDERYCDYKELEEKSTIIKIVQKTESGEESQAEWVKDDVILEIQFLKDEDKVRYQDYVTSIKWTGNNHVEQVNLNQDFEEKKQFIVHATQFMNIEYEVSVTIRYEEKTYIYKAYTQVKIDRQSPIIYKDDVEIEHSDEWQSVAKKVSLISSDYNGSGIYGYVATDYPSCSTNVEDYTPLHRSRFDIFLTQGVHYVCVMDMVGNISDPVSIEITKTDNGKPTLGDFEVLSSLMGSKYYQELTLQIPINDGLSGVSMIKYCFTNHDCMPNKVRKVNADGVGIIAFEEGMPVAQKVCVIGVDQAGNESDKKCSDSYLFDPSGPVISKLVEHNYEISFAADDTESSIERFQIYLSEDGTNYRLEKELITTNTSGSYLLEKLKSNVTYYVKLVVTNQAGIASEQVIQFTPQFQMKDAINQCNAKNGYCEQGVYVKYGENIYVLYRKTTNSIFGVNVSNNMRTSIINDFCCDQGTCIEENVYNTSWSGIYSDGRDNSLKTYYDKLPSPSKYLNLESYSFGVVTGLPTGNYIGKKTIQARFGLLDLGEYQSIYNKPYIKDIGTLLSTVYTVCLSSDHYECNNDVDNITGVYALNGVLRSPSAVTGAHHDINVNAAMTVPFKNTISFVHGNGTIESPYVVE